MAYPVWTTPPGIGGGSGALPDERLSDRESARAPGAVAGIGEVVKRERVKAGLTQARLAELCGVRQCRISSIERGRVTPTLASLSRIAAALGKTVKITLE